MVADELLSDRDFGGHWTLRKVYYSILLDNICHNINTPMYDIGTAIICYLVDFYATVNFSGAWFNDDACNISKRNNISVNFGT
jgi:hypothetical protein